MSSEEPPPIHDHSKDLIINEGFAALNTFVLGKTSDGVSDPIPKYPFASFHSAVKVNLDEIDNIMHDCELAFTARTREDSESYSTGATFFMPAVMKPRCALEALASDIFKAHTKDLEPGKHFDPERSGAEFWTLVLENKQKTTRDVLDDNQMSQDKVEKDDNEEDEEDEDDEVGMHFDADYGLEQQLPNYMLHPRVATVTYLSNVGAPTLILDKKSPPPSDVNKASLNGSIHQGWLSHPIMGKHIAFDGRLLHGAPATFFPSMDNSAIEEKEEPDTKRRKLNNDKSENTPSGKRVTFLVNVWLNHCPIDAEMLEDDLVSQMKSTWVGKNGNDTKEGKGSSDDVIPAFKWSLESVHKTEDNDTATLETAQNESNYAGEENVVICNHEVDVKYNASMQDLHAVSKAAFETKDKSIHLYLKSNVVELVVGEEVPDSDDEENEQ